MHDAVPETQAVAVRLHQLELIPPVNCQPDIKVARGKSGVGKQPDLRVDSAVFRRLAYFLLIGLLALIIIAELDLDGVRFQSDAGQRRKPLDGGLALLAVQRHGRHQVPLEKRLQPQVEQVKPQLRAIHIAQVHRFCGPVG